MKVLFRQFLFLIALAIATGPAMAKDQSTSGTSKLKKSLFSKKSASSSPEGKSQYKKIVVNINKASASAMSAYLVGVGPTKAKAIVDYRRKNGKFTSAKDLMNVDGIGEATFNGLKKNISTSRGETRPPKGYKMGEASKKSGSSKKTSSKKAASSKTTSKSGTSRTGDKSASSDTDSGSKTKARKQKKTKKTKAGKESKSDKKKKKKKTKKTKSEKKSGKKKKSKKKDK